MTLHRDFRKLDPTTQAELRRVAVGMVEAGKTRVEAAAAVGVSRRFVGEWVEAARRLGDAALEGGRRGRRPGEQKPLSPPQERRIRQLIADRCPDQLKLPFSLWTREAVGALIERGAKHCFARGAAVGLRPRAHPAGLGLHRAAPGAPGYRAARARGPSALGCGTSTRRSPPEPRPKAPRSTGRTRPACPTKPTTAGASPRRARRPSCRGRRRGSRNP